MPPILLRSPDTRSLTPLIFGKLPNRPDFVRLNATHPAAMEFDALIQTALQQLRATEDWEGHYDQAPPSDFTYITRDGKWAFTGALQRSLDQSGRRYPLVAGVVRPIAQVQSRVPLAPVACEVFFLGLREHLLSAVENSVEALACRQFLEAQAELWSTEDSDYPLAEEIVHHFMASTLPSSLEPSSDGMVSFSIGQALLNITFYRDFLRRYPNTLLTLDLPLHGSPAEETLFASAWLKILAALSHPSDAQNLGFFLKRGSGQSHLLASFGKVPGETCQMALGGQPAGDFRLSLTHEQPIWQSHKLYPEIAYAMHRALLSPHFSIQALLDFLKDASLKIASSH